MSIRTVGELRKLIKGLPAGAWIGIKQARPSDDYEPEVELGGFSIETRDGWLGKCLVVTVAFTYLTDDDSDGEFADDEEVPAGLLF